MTGLKNRSDDDLYRAVRKGDRGALGELYERREPGLYRYALYVSGSRAVAEEVTHDIFLRLIGPGVPFDEKRGSLEAYLYGVARNLLRMRPPLLSPWHLPLRVFAAHLRGLSAGRSDHDSLLNHLNHIVGSEAV